MNDTRSNVSPAIDHHVRGADTRLAETIGDCLRLLGEGPVGGISADDPPTG